MHPFTTINFSLYVNDLMGVLRREEIGVRIDHLIILSLLFADNSESVIKIFRFKQR